MSSNVSPAVSSAVSSAFSLVMSPRPQHLLAAAVVASLGWGATAQAKEPVATVTIAADKPTDSPVAPVAVQAATVQPTAPVQAAVTPVDVGAVMVVEPVEDPNARRRVGGWGGLSLGVTEVNNGPATLFGFAGGVQMNERFTIGFAGEGIASWAEADPGLFPDGKARGGDEDWDSERGGDGSEHYIEGGWGGLMLAFEPWSDAFIHPVVSATFGVGAITYSQRQHEDGWDDSWDVNADLETDDDRPVGLFGATELSAGAALNLSRWCRLDGEFSYRWVSGLEDFDGVDDSEMSGPTIGLGLRFGAF